jgi:hypothetical protein
LRGGSHCGCEVLSASKRRGGEWRCRGCGRGRVGEAFDLLGVGSRKKSWRSCEWARDRWRGGPLAAEKGPLAAKRVPVTDGGWAAAEAGRILSL